MPLYDHIGPEINEIFADKDKVSEVSSPIDIPTTAQVILWIGAITLIGLGLLVWVIR